MNLSVNATPACRLSGDHVQVAGRSFVKMHGLGNHFLIVDARSQPCEPTPAEVVRICDVHTGVGADQVLVIEKPGVGSGATAFMRIFNVDGREAGACGNASRCVAWLLLEEQDSDAVVIETRAGLLACTRRGHLRVSVDMGRIAGDWTSIPLRAACDTLHVPVGNGVLRDPVALNIGNPHVVFFVDDLASVDLAVLAPRIQQDPLFPEQVNVGVAEIVSDGHIRLSVYERPGILTRACGSGACVAARALQLRGYSTRRHFRVDMAGGTVEVELCDDDRAVMSGPVEFCFRGTLAFSTRERADG